MIDGAYPSVLLRGKDTPISSDAGSEQDGDDPPQREIVDHETRRRDLANAPRGADTDQGPDCLDPAHDSALNALNPYRAARCAVCIKSALRFVWCWQSHATPCNGSGLGCGVHPGGSAHAKAPERRYRLLLGGVISAACASSATRVAVRIDLAGRLDSASGLR